MCGIAGILNIKSAKQPDRLDLSAMIDRLHHRGPDGTGSFIDDKLGFAYARLSIIDIASGDQPIHNENKTVWVIFNGEIFNYVELRAQLMTLGHHFYTQSDTEVIVHLYDQYGEKFVDNLYGQFAIALWDEKQKKLVLARDRTGICPRFYTETAGRLLFASESEALFS